MVAVMYTQCIVQRERNATVSIEIAVTVSMIVEISQMKLIVDLVMRFFFLCMENSFNGFEM